MPDAPYTPTTEDVRDEYVQARSLLPFYSPDRSREDEAHTAEFDRWFAAVIRAATAWERAEIVAELRAKFGVTNRAADYLARASSPSESEA